MLDRKLRNRLIDDLILVPGSQTLDGRTDLLSGLPGNLIAALNRDQSAMVDLGNIVTWLEGLGRLEKTGERPLLIVADNALRRVRGAELGRRLHEIIAEMEEQYGGEVPPGELGLSPEILIFKGRDFRLSITYLQRALETARGVARLMVPRSFGGTLKEGSFAYGTGWLVAPGLLFTNRHVTEARFEGERPASEADLAIQGRNTTAWFDYHREGGERREWRSLELVCTDQALDYALLRLEDGARSESRPLLALAPGKPELSVSDRLNIVQHGGGGPMKFAIRNNFYVGKGTTANHIHYVTDTEAGASGSPVLDDTWQVVAMHHAHQKVKDKTFKGENIQYHNQGVLLHSILGQLPGEIRREIETARGGTL